MARLVFGTGSETKCMLKGERGTNDTQALPIQKVMAGTGSAEVVAYQPLVTGTNSRGTFAVPSSTWTEVFSGTIVGCGKGKLTCVYNWGQDALQWLSYNRQVEILVNGVRVQFQSRDQTTQSWGVTLEHTQEFHDGDTWAMRGYSTGSSTSTRNIDSSNYTLAVAF
ncbi:hypothetical protein SEA_GUYFAGIERI_24 [Rhodococcus phage GuyFagieri]|nr:hypothetical protein SEA_GUYFAGIERI_24 [Rhodococcus phage GuyFagieri]